MKSIDKEMNRVCCFFLLLVIVSCGNEKAANEKSNLIENSIEKTNNDSESSIKLNDYQWISGTWVDTTTFSNYRPSGHYIEKWSIHKDSVYGLGYKVVAEDTTITRYMSIRKLEDGPVFIEREIGHSMVSYYFLGINDSSFSFTNKAQMFPRDIIYNSHDVNTMSIVLKGLAGEFEREIKMRFNKVDF